MRTAKYSAIFLIAKKCYNARQRNEAVVARVLFQLCVLIIFDCHGEQETQLWLTNRATRLEIIQGHQTWYHSI